jgi:hypothetical protein
MSELKVYVKPLKTNVLGQTIVGQSYYLKSEADKVIAELEESHKKEVGQLLMEIAELKQKLEEERRWRKCSDEMPEDGAEVLASDGVGIWLCYKTTLSDGSPWFQPDGLPHIEGVTHWMPLPSAPKEENE